jgi:hypothetical protein|tara:strand:+ start:1545 stop:1760 length:216 start_codon:yes stop_codon:yes gene_type:complete
MQNNFWDILTAHLLVFLLPLSVMFGVWGSVNFVMWEIQPVKWAFVRMALGLGFLLEVTFILVSLSFKEKDK